MSWATYPSWANGIPRAPYVFAVTRSCACPDSELERLQVRLLPAQYPVWAGSVVLPSSTPVSYKYICKAPGQAVVWEEPPYKNREAVTPDADQERGTIRDAWY